MRVEHRGVKGVTVLAHVLLRVLGPAVDGQRQHLEPRRGVPAMQPVEVRVLPLAERAPARPQLDHQHLVAPVRGRQLAAVEQPRGRQLHPGADRRRLGAGRTPRCARRRARLRERRRRQTRQREPGGAPQPAAPAPGG